MSEASEVWKLVQRCRLVSAAFACCLGTCQPSLSPLASSHGATMEAHHNTPHWPWSRCAESKRYMPLHAHALHAVTSWSRCAESRRASVGAAAAAAAGDDSASPPSRHCVVCSSLPSRSRTPSRPCLPQVHDPSCPERAPHPPVTRWSNHIDLHRCSSPCVTPNV